MCPLASKARLAQRWRWPIDLSRYDRSPGLQAAEAKQLHELVERFDRGATTWPHGGRENLARLLQPLNDTLQFTRCLRMDSGRCDHTPIPSDGSAGDDVLGVASSGVVQHPRI